MDAQVSHSEEADCNERILKAHADQNTEQQRVGWGSEDVVAQPSPVDLLEAEGVA